MKVPTLSVICGLKVLDVLPYEQHGGWISFENGIGLAIYNSSELLGFPVNDIQQLIGKIVTHVDDGDETVTIKFENNVVLRVDMRDEAYIGPEAMLLHVPGEPYVIWGLSIPS
ncbi:MAG: hypothetical protein H3C47_10605 [Candidatus Cloacimonetes bacterium]|nr:hypothetical protein [Candidatus Cloacimonadota bacterium]